jgi:hypothetical protein
MGKVVGCPKHGVDSWVGNPAEGWIQGESYCSACIRERYLTAPQCPHCGIKQGFAPGTGDCGCDVDPE